MARIELHGVSKRFPDGTVALHETDLVVEDGELFVLVGPSGCGKSTLLNLIAGLEVPSGGEILVNGRAVNGVDPKDRNIAMVFQNYALYPHMTVRDNIAFPLRMAGKTKSEIARRVEQTAALLELAPLLDRRPQELSGGQRQRVAMGRALVREPAAFLLDEPLSNLDARLRVQTRVEIARLRKRLGATMIHVTHDQTEALTLGDRIAVMERGTVSQVGTPRELYDAPRNRFVAGFIGEPAMNFLPGEIRNEQLLLPIGTYPLPGGLPDATGDIPRRIIAGFRPGDVQVAADHSSGAVFEAIVDVLEWTGADLHARLRLDGGDTEIIVRLERTSEVREGERLMLTMAGERMHLFDEASGVNLVGRGHGIISP